MLTRLLFSLPVLALALLLSGCGSDAPTASSAVRFVVAESAPSHGDSYILPLTDPQDIAQARALIADPGAALPRIVVARIAAGTGSADERNFDVLNGSRPWSWHVTEFLGFADSTIEILDGWPGYVEAHLQDWLQMTNSTVGFWSYTVTAELPAGG